MNDADLLRYSRQILLPQIDIAGQQALAKKTVLIIGLGGLGSPVALYLAAAGVGRLLLSDPDVVELSNLQRQIIHDSTQLGQNKTYSAKQRLQALNPDCQIELFNHALTGNALQAAAQRADVIVDCSDNFATRYAVNHASVNTKTPLVSAAAIRFEGQISVFIPAKDNSPCYHCLYPQQAEMDDSVYETCSNNGVIAPLVGVLGSMQALETLKILLKLGEVLSGRLLLFDALTMQWRNLKLSRDPACPVCSADG